MTVTIYDLSMSKCFQEFMIPVLKIFPVILKWKYMLKIWNSKVVLFLEELIL